MHLAIDVPDLFAVEIDVWLEALAGRTRQLDFNRVQSELSPELYGRRFSLVLGMRAWDLDPTMCFMHQTVDRDGVFAEMEARQRGLHVSAHDDRDAAVHPGVARLVFREDDGPWTHVRFVYGYGIAERLDQGALLVTVVPRRRAWLELDEVAGAVEVARSPLRLRGSRRRTPCSRGVAARYRSAHWVGYGEQSAGMGLEIDVGQVMTWNSVARWISPEGCWPALCRAVHLL